jgi:hypothetical protein
MTMSKKLRSNIWMVVKSVVAGSLVVTRVFGGPAAINPGHAGLVNDWRILGQQMGEKPTDLPPLSDHLIDMIESADLENNLSEIVLASYSMVDADLFSSLDAHWAAVLTSAGNAPLVVEFLNLRYGISAAGVPIGEADNLVWLEKVSGGDCDDGCNNGGGNGSEGGCSPGQGSGAHDDETKT